MPNRAIWCLRGSLDKNASFSSLFYTFRLILLYRHSLQQYLRWQKPLRLPKHACEVPDIQKSIFAAHVNLFIILLSSFSVSLAPKWLMLASCYGYKRYTQSQCECKCTIDCHKTLLHVSFIDIEDLCTLQDAILYHSTLPGYIYIHVRKSIVRQIPTACLSFSVELAGHAG